ncbi:MAG: hypothetical protein ABIQ31_26805 [Ferruginibacter sp.]
MKNAILGQRKMNKLLATTTGSDERTAFMYASQVKRRLSVPVTNELFVSLVHLCHKIGIEGFNNSIALSMVNTNHSKASIKKYICAMLN